MTKIRAVELLELDRAEMEALAVSLEQPSYRGRQLYQWIFARHCGDLDQMSDLPKTFRARLQENARLHLPAVENVQGARDGTRKYLLSLGDGVGIEMVAIPHQRGNQASFTLCVSTQAGCPLACAFCATGASGFRRNLGAGEILGQVIRAHQDLQPVCKQGSDHIISNIVFMGMGEPLLNYEATVRAVRVINDPGGINIGQRHITISTAGIVPGILRLAEEGLQVTLAISLHAADDAKRDRLVPINRKYPLSRLMDAADRYIAVTGRRISLEYVLLHGINTTRDDARNLSALTRGRLVNINLIPFNATGSQYFCSPEREEIKRFVRWLTDSGVAVTVRKEHGADIDAACGQLVLRSHH